MIAQAQAPIKHLNKLTFDHGKIKSIDISHTNSKLAYRGEV